MIRAAAPIEPSSGGAVPARAAGGEREDAFAAGASSEVARGVPHSPRAGAESAEPCSHPAGAEGGEPCSHPAGKDVEGHLELSPDAAPAPSPTGLAFLLALPIRLYRALLSPLLPPSCRFHPSCSRYALQALAVHGAARGSWLTAGRLLRCHPFCDGGIDPVPPRGT